MARRVTSLKDSDPMPESDRVEGFAHPRDNYIFYGHQDAERELADAFQIGKVHHGWLLSGLTGIGKATLAYRFAKYILAKDDERDPSQGILGLRRDSLTARLVRAQSHPGLLVLRRPYDLKTKRFATTIPVDEVRRVRNFLTHSASEQSWRIVIIDTADEMNINAANAVLKSLEEPPERAIFLLITSEPGQLLATIRSRCRLLKMSVLSQAELDRASRHAFEASKMAMPGDEDWESLLVLGSGRVGRVLGLAGIGGVDIFSDVEGVLRSIKKPVWHSVHALGDKLAPIASVKKFDLFMELLLERMSQLVLARMKGEGTPEDVELAQRLIDEQRIPQWASLWEDILRSKAEAAALNLDRKAFFIETIQKVHELARKAA